MTSNDIVRIIQELSLYCKLELNQEALQPIRVNQRNYGIEELDEFKRDLVEAGRKNSLLVLEQNIKADQVDEFVKESRDPLLVFNLVDGVVWPEIIVSDGSKSTLLLSGRALNPNDKDHWLQTPDGRFSCLILIPKREIFFGTAPEGAAGQTPIRRLLRLFGTEKKDILYILIYAVIIGLLGLALPLGLQTTIEFISGGVFFSSVYILISLVIVGILSVGILQIVQITLVEHVQRRIFVKAALDFAYRIPHIRLESITKSYAPELVNRFFDVITIQKGLPKFLLDLSSGVIQVFFGLLLLSLYHPFFVFFSFFLIAVLVIMFTITGPKGLSSSINESKYKYVVAQWLEELARTIMSFKLAGNTNLPVRRTDEVAGNYIRYRRKHFNILRIQFSFFVFLKVAITGGLLIMGTILVVDRQITLGQFVASEVIIVLVLNATEKIILYIDVVYDLLTAVDKVSHVTDLPIEKTGGFDLPSQANKKGYSISIEDLNYRYSNGLRSILNNVNLEIKPGERVCISGPGGSGKTTLANIVGGLYTDYTGGVSINKYSLRDLDITNLRDKVAKNISPDDIFDGTIYENITVGKSTVKLEDVLEVVQTVGLGRYLNSLPLGLNTPLISGGKGLASSLVNRLILARCLAKKPELLVLNDFFSGLSKADKLELVGCAINPNRSWTLLAVSNDPMIMAACDRVIVLVDGQIVADGAYEALIKDGTISKHLE